MLTGVLAVASCQTSAGRAGAQGQTPSLQQVCAQPWSVRPAWTSKDSPRLQYPLDEPTVARFGATYILAGNTLRPMDPTPMGDSVALVTLDGRRFDLPTDARTGSYPVVAAAGDTLYLIWGEPVPASHPRFSGLWPPFTTAVWYATRVGLEPWSSARELLRADEARWSSPDVSLATAADGVLEVVFTAHEAAEGWLVLARFSGGGASLHRMPLKGGPVHAQMARRGDTAFVLLVKADTERRRDQNSLFLTTWHSGTRSWGPLRLVQQGREEGAVYPRLMLTRDGAMHAIWTQLGANVLRHMRSLDGGVTWSAATDLPVPGAYANAGFAIGDSAVGVLFDDPDTLGRWRLRIACWNGAWLPPLVIGEVRVGSPALLDSRSLSVIALRENAQDPWQFHNVVATPQDH